MCNQLKIKKKHIVSFLKYMYFVNKLRRQYCTDYIFYNFIINFFLKASDIEIIAYTYTVFIIVNVEKYVIPASKKKKSAEFTFFKLNYIYRIFRVFNFILFYCLTKYVIQKIGWLILKIVYTGLFSLHVLSPFHNCKRFRPVLNSPRGIT